MYLWLLSLVSIFCLPLEAPATMLPENLSLLEISGMNADLEDPDLKKWREAYIDQKPIQELTAKALQKKLTKLDEFTRIFVALRYANANYKKSSTQVQDAINFLKSVEDQKLDVLEVHPLAPYLLEEIIESEGLKSSYSAKIEDQILAAGSISCPQRTLIQSRIKNERATNIDIPEILDLITSIQRSKSFNYREESFELLLDMLSKNQRKLLRATLSPIIADYSDISEDHDWLFPEGQISPSSEQGASLINNDLLTANLKRRRCSRAEKMFEKSLKKTDNIKLFVPAEDVAMDIESCYRRSGHRARAKFWDRISKQLQKSFGFAGLELALRRQGAIYWGVDNFGQARKFFMHLIELARTWNDRVAESEAIFTLARIAENEGDFAKSIEFHEEYFRRFPAGEKRQVVQKSLVLLKSSMGEKEKALTYAQLIISEESMGQVDDRSSSSLSFALFWAGRLHLHLGQKTMAIAMWSRVAREYYSTYYGAIGHFLLEKLTDKSFALYPSRTVKFEPKNLIESFEETNQALSVRIQTLLKLGLAEEAQCELSELKITDGDSDEQSARALFHYAAGNWLKAIKIYDSLPRSYRNELPVGYERILFPRAYQQAVVNYSGNVGVDPDLVLAIIRQESVFNPKARSGVGASGLMQLMPATARGEAKRLSRNYLTSAKRRKLRAAVRSRHNLFDADVNLAVGIHHVFHLLKKYKNPVFLLTSYNANPRATRRWAKKLATDDITSFIERIPYRETQVYVKLVLRNYFYYKRWYADSHSMYSVFEKVLSKDMTAIKNHKKL
jgi:soluble lytic murein transglycosylase-like protein